MNTFTPEEQHDILSAHLATEGMAGIMNKMGFRRPPTGPEADAILLEAAKQRNEELRIRAYTDAIKEKMPEKFTSRPARIVILGTKGGVGKTLTCILIAKIFRNFRHADPVVIINSDPSVGTNLVQRTLGREAADFSRIPKSAPIPSIATVAEHYDKIESGQERVQQYLRTAKNEGVMVLPAGDDPRIISQYDEETLEKVLKAMKLFSSFLFIDNGAEASNKFALAGLNVADALVMVTDNTDDAHDGVDKLAKFVRTNYPHLADNSLLVVNRKAVAPRDIEQSGEVRPLSSASIARVAENYGIATNSEFPYDPSLVLGGRVDFDKLSASRRIAALGIAAQLASIIRSQGD